MISQGGSVYLVGAGPGDPELITVRGLRLIRSADVVIHDRLIAHELLNECSPDAEIIDVGKYPDHHRISQEEINLLIIERALAGKKVVRLKGGDPFVFGRGQEELEVCRAVSVPCTVIPGISSALAGPLSAGVPVTTRGVARSFAVITGQTDPKLGEHQHDFAALAKIDTVVFMMGRRNLSSLMQGLIDNGRSSTTPVTCVERATTKQQRVATGTLATIYAKIESLNMSSPMITVVGDVAEFVDPHLIESALDQNQIRLKEFALPELHETPLQKTAIS